MKLENNLAKIIFIGVIAIIIIIFGTLIYLISKPTSTNEGLIIPETNHQEFVYINKINDTIPQSIIF